MEHEHELMDARVSDPARNELKPSRRASTTRNGAMRSSGGTVNAGTAEAMTYDCALLLH